MNKNIIYKLKVFYCKRTNASDIVEFFSDIKGYEYLIECIKKYIELLKTNENSKYSLPYKGELDRESILNFLFKKKGDVTTISLTHNLEQNVEIINLYATIELYEYLKECLNDLVEELRESDLAEITLDSGIDVDCDSPSLGFYYLRY